MSKHTAKPWKICRPHETEGPVICDLLNSNLVVPANGQDLGEIADDERLIRLAPDTLDALEDCKSHLATVLFALRKDNPRHSWIPEAEKGLSEAKKAIAKAKGELE